MRITNKIMQRNNLSNINTNKIYQDKLSTQMSTQKKINKPSDDPVVAIRALRLRSSVTEITQYYSKNIPDAESWLNVTEDALKNLSQVMTSMIEQCTRGANGDLKNADREIILEQMKALGEEVYATGDADYAGRYVFTGYRTDTSLSFPSNKTQTYEITEQLDRNAIDSMKKVESGNLLDWTSANYSTLTDADEQAVEVLDVYRIRLAYNDCSEAMTPVISYKEKAADGTESTVSLDSTMVHSYADPSPYKQVEKDPSAIIYVPETGELLLGKNRYEELMAVKDDVSTVKNEGEIQITYRKDEWLKGDLRPEHYFYCKSDPGTEEEIEYNATFLGDTPERQILEYDVGFNQTIRVNSTADECFQHGIGREVDDLVSAMQETMDLDNIKTKIEKEMAGADEATKAKLQVQLDGAKKALDLSKDKCQKLFEKGITVFQNYLNDANLSITDCGTRSKKLELIENRMQSQKTTFETLKSENEDVDITDVAITLNSAELTYEAALMATGKVVQTTLLNFI